MFCRNLVKVYTQIIVSISMVLLGASICPVQAEFPRISFIDPYWVHAGFDDYWPQMDSCGITHSVTLGDNISLNNSANIYILDSNLDSVSNYATGIENKYNIGGTESDFSPAEPEYNYYDDDDEIERWVYRVLCDSNSAGVVFSGSFNPWGQRRKRNYWFIFKMKMVGETSGSDTIAQVHVWETSAKSNGSEEELHAGIPWDYLEVGEGEKADDWLYILPNR